MPTSIPATAPAPSVLSSLVGDARLIFARQNSTSMLPVLSCRDAYLPRHRASWRLQGKKVMLGRVKYCPWHRSSRFLNSLQCCNLVSAPLLQETQVSRICIHNIQQSCESNSDWFVVGRGDFKLQLLSSVQMATWIGLRGKYARPPEANKGSYTMGLCRLIGCATGGSN